MNIDFSALDQLDKLASPAVSQNAPKYPIADIDEDPNQPRTEFDAEAMAELTESVKLRGVLQPVSMRKHPTQPGRYMLNHGARRLRAAKAAGLTEIPAYVDEEYDDYDQVIENEQRSNLSAMELAAFIQRRIKKGEKKGDIAKKLFKKDPMFVTRHLALIEAPAEIEALYRSGRCRDVTAIYNLRRLYDAHPAEVAEWLATEPDITKSTVAAIESRIKGKAAGAASAEAGQGSDGTDVTDGIPEPAAADSSGPGADAPSKTERKPAPSRAGHALGRAKLIAEVKGVRGYLTPAGTGTGMLMPLDGTDPMEVALGDVRLVEWVT